MNMRICAEVLHMECVSVLVQEQQFWLICIFPDSRWADLWSGILRWLSWEAWWPGVNNRPSVCWCVLLYRPPEGNQENSLGGCGPRWCCMPSAGTAGGGRPEWQGVCCRWCAASTDDLWAEQAADPFNLSIPSADGEVHPMLSRSPESSL